MAGQKLNSKTTPGKASDLSTPLALLLAEQIRARGPIPFIEYMEACLYHEVHGYYTRQSQSQQRDFFTNADESPIFARLLARQLHQMWTLLDRPASFCLAEAGAGSGILARQILDFAAAAFPEFYESLQYIAVERSAVRRSVAEVALAKHARNGHFFSLAHLPEIISCGCILSNEFFDALPVHRVLRENGELRELYVGLHAGGFRDMPGPPSTPALAEYLKEHGIEMQEGQQAEVCLAACEWMAQAAVTISRGFLLTIDYGYEAAELYGERHGRGTLLAYQGHQASEDYFRAPGEQDLTAHVNFTVLARCGRRGGLIPAGKTSQSNFLLALARHSEFADVEPSGAGEPPKIQARHQFKMLIHPGGMGETFQVLLQHKEISVPRLAGFDPL